MQSLRDPKGSFPPCSSSLSTRLSSPSTAEAKSWLFEHVNRIASGSDKGQRMGAQETFVSKASDPFDETDVQARPSFPGQASPH